MNSNQKSETGKLIFINHSSFLVEGTNSILLIDPWVQGTAFNNGWALLDQSTSNTNLINYLEKSSKKLFIWYSHEHSDHFSVSFVHELKSRDLDLVFLFHQTRDKRVIEYLKNQDFKVIEVLDGEEIVVELDFSIRTWNFYAGDSYSLIRYKDIEILNLNDCDVRSQELADELSQNIEADTKKISFLFTQFGYANWIGNECDTEKREAAATSNRKRIRLQADTLRPKVIVPFASFIYFCHPENWYMNDKQNSPQMIIDSEELIKWREQIRFLKPWQEIELKSENCFEKLEAESNQSLRHWQTCLDRISPIDIEEEIVNVNDLLESMRRYRRLINRKFRYLPFLWSFLRMIPAVYVRTWDDGQIYKCSYATKPKIQKNADHWDIGMSRSTALFLFNREYGADTLSVSARFRCSSDNSYERWQEFFKIQIFLRENIGSESFVSALRTTAIFPIGAFKKLLLKNHT